MKKYVFIAVDMQNDFGTEGGKHYSSKESKKFVEDVFTPFLKEKRIKINEIISDYRPPRPGDRGDCCHPGEWGYQSIIPSDLVQSRWVKCMNSPVWSRDNIGQPDKEPGLPYQDVDGFGKWLEQEIGNPDEVTPVLLGWTIDCCVLSTCQELSWRGYYPIILREGVDHSSGKIEDRDQILKDPIPNWGEVVSWEEIEKDWI